MEGAKREGKGSRAGARDRGDGTRPARTKSSSTSIFRIAEGEGSFRTAWALRRGRSPTRKSTSAVEGDQALLSTIQRRAGATAMGVKQKVNLEQWEEG